MNTPVAGAWIKSRYDQCFTGSSQCPSQAITPLSPGQGKKKSKHRTDFSLFPSLRSGSYMVWFCVGLLHLTSRVCETRGILSYECVHIYLSVVLLMGICFQFCLWGVVQFFRVSFGEYVYMSVGVHRDWNYLGYSLCVYSEQILSIYSVLPALCESSLSSTSFPTLDTLCLHFGCSDGCGSSSSLWLALHPSDCLWRLLTRRYPVPGSPLPTHHLLVCLFLTSM